LRSPPSASRAPQLARLPPAHRSRLFKSGVLNKLHRNAASGKEVKNPTNQNQNQNHGRGQNRNHNHNTRSGITQYRYDRRYVYEGHALSQHSTMETASPLNGQLTNDTKDANVSSQTTRMESTSDNVSTYMYHESISNLSQARSIVSKADGTPRTINAALINSSRAHSGTSTRKNSSSERSRLEGADLYVCRIGNFKQPGLFPPALVPRIAEADPAELDTDTDSDLTSSTSTMSLAGSLHDELVESRSRNKPDMEPMSDSMFDRNKILASRPCYRCVHYMHSVGIKRVFWTNQGGQWEGAKVHELVSALDRRHHDGILDPDLLET
jgi:hypothetical protein